MPLLKTLLILAVSSFAVMHRPAAATLLDSNDMTPLGPNPFTWAGTYSVRTTGATSTLTGPGIGSVSGVVSTDIAVFTFHDTDRAQGITTDRPPNAALRPLALLSRDFFSLTGMNNGSQANGGGGHNGGAGAGSNGVVLHSVGRGLVDASSSGINGTAGVGGSGGHAGYWGPSGSGRVGGIEGVLHSGGSVLVNGPTSALKGAGPTRVGVSSPGFTGSEASGNGVDDGLDGIGETVYRKLLAIMPGNGNRGGGAGRTKEIEMIGGLLVNDDPGETVSTGDASALAGTGGAPGEGTAVHGDAITLSASLGDTESTGGDAFASGKPGVTAISSDGDGERTAFPPTLGTIASRDGGISGGVVSILQLPVQAIPEPGTLLLLGAGLAGLLTARRGKRSDPNPS